MFSHNGKISTRQVLILLVLQMFNINMLIMPRVCTQFLGRDGYIVPIVAILAGAIFLLCITSLTTKFENRTFVEICKSLLPEWIAYILLGIFTIKMIISIGLELRMFCEMISQVMLPRTPISVIMIIMLLAVVYLVKSGVEAIGRMGEILLYFVVLPLGIALLSIIFRTDYKELLPFMRIELENISWGVLGVSAIFVPLEVLLMLNGLMRDPRKVRAAGIGAVVTIGILQGILTLLCITQIGLGETRGQMWPVILLMKSIGMNNTVVENQEVLMVIIWIFSVFIYISIGLYVISLIGSRSLKFRRENVFVLPAVPIILLAAMYPQDLGRAYDAYLRFQYLFGVWFIIPIPLILLLIYKIRGDRCES